MNTDICFSLECVKKYIQKCIENNSEIFFFNELELQIFVARELEKVFNKDYKVHLEYQLPKGWNENFDNEYEQWRTEKPYFDIVLEHENQFIAIELKYKLKEIKLNKENQLLRFGLKAKDENLILVTNQSAENEGRYDFWKDVKRIEVLSKAFDNVIGGIAIFVTNQENYKNNKENFKYSNFNLSDSKQGYLYWNGEDENGEKLNGEKLKKNRKGEEYWIRPNFTLDGEYSNLEWTDFRGALNEKFHYYSVIVPKLYKLK